MSDAKKRRGGGTYCIACRDTYHNSTKKFFRFPKDLDRYVDFGFRDQLESESVKFMLIKFCYLTPMHVLFLLSQVSRVGYENWQR